MYAVPAGPRRPWHRRPVIWAAVAVQLAHALLWRSLIASEPRAFDDPESFILLGPVALGAALVAWATVRHARDRLSALVLWLLVAALGIWTLGFGYYMQPGDVIIN